jgi:hypothetical protein
MPHPAPALAEIAHGEPLELVAARLEPHALELLPRTALVLAARAGGAAEFLQARRQPVALELELAEVGQARAAAPSARRGRGRDCRRSAQEGEALRERQRELALEPCDLRLQGGARGALVLGTTVHQDGPLEKLLLALHLRRSFRRLPRE